ncbi:MAG: aldo/keto reductase [Candidatus Rokubacteria bacterium]|nr:aldo/keto reductase [Candidatus Rokubacteria bacterium]
MIAGCATPEGTDAYRRRMEAQTAPAHFRSFGGVGLSSLGIGTYLGDEDAATDELYRDAVARALERGVNVVDTAINYRHQRSERAVGQALAGLVQRGALRREEVVVATKGGFIPFDGAVPANPRGYFTETYLRPGIIGREDVVAGCHCMTPRYLADQLERSRRNLGLDTLDVYYVHNPEMQLGEVDRSEFLERIRATFAFLESAVGDGKIGCYGTATWNGCRQPRTARDYLSLAELEEVAREVAGDHHHFRVIQLPYNLAMSEAFTRANQLVDGEAVSALEAARRLGIYVMVSASIYQGQLSRNLPPVLGQHLPGLRTDAQRALQFVRSTPGVGTALVGMKRAAHVEENLALTKVPPVPWEEFQRLFQQA